MPRELLLPWLIALAAVAGSAAGQPVHGADDNGAVPARTLAVEPHDPAWDDRLVVPLVERLRPVGRYEPEQAPTGEIVDRVIDRPTDLGLMRRSSLPRDCIENGATLFVEVGPAACLVLAVAPTAPWRSYTELNYAAPARGLRVGGAGATGLEAFARLRERFPLRSTLIESKQPFRLGVQRLLSGQIDVFAFEVVRHGPGTVPPDFLVEAMGQGVRLLQLPIHLHNRDDSSFGVGEVPLESPTFLRSSRYYNTFCDPFVMVFTPSFAEVLFDGLYRNPEAGAGTNPEDRPNFFTQLEMAVHSFMAMMQRWL